MMEMQVKFLHLLEGMRTDFLNAFFEGITILGEETLLVIVIVIFWFAVDKRIAEKLFFIIITSMGANGVIKNLVKMPRPFASGKISCVRPETATGYSFPSGHTQNFATWITFAAIKVRGKLAVFIAVLFICMVAFSRMFLGAHYPMDVIAGAALGIFFAFAGNAVFDRADRKLSLYKAALIIFAPFAVWFILFPDFLYADFFKVYGMMAGAYSGLLFEEKYAPLSYDVTAFKKTVRVIAGVLLALFLKTALKSMFVFESVRPALAFDSVRYFVLIFIMTGLCPLIFKKLKL